MEAWSHIAHCMSTYYVSVVSSYNRKRAYVYGLFTTLLVPYSSWYQSVL